MVRVRSTVKTPLEEGKKKKITRLSLMYCTILIITVYISIITKACVVIFSVLVLETLQNVRVKYVTV